MECLPPPKGRGSTSFVDVLEKAPTHGRPYFSAGRVVPPPTLLFINIYPPTSVREQRLERSPRRMPPTPSPTRATSAPLARPAPAPMLPTAASAAANAANAASKLSSSLAKASTSAASARRAPSSLASALTLSLVCLASKAFLRTTASVRVTGREHLYSALGIGAMGDVPWDKRRGVITSAYLSGHVGRVVRLAEGAGRRRGRRPFASPGHLHSLAWWLVSFHASSLFSPSPSRTAACHSDVLAQSCR